MTNSAESQDAYRAVMQHAVDLLCKHVTARPYSGKTPAELAEFFQGEVLTEGGLGADAIRERLHSVVANSVMLTHPNTAAHLHCPPLIAALAAEAVISALNQSMDSFDQAPAATMLEERMVDWLKRELGFPGVGGGIFTAGGTQSNYMALLLARDGCLEQRWQWNAQTRGLPNEARRLRILCSDVSHFTVEKSAAQLGLGTDSVIRVATDAGFRMNADALGAALEELRRRDLVPMTVVATAGTTDFGSIDPLAEIAVMAREAGAWFHVDAAYGSALLFSAKHRSLLHGIDLADSVSMDFHKLFWQPISCAALLLRDAKNFRHIELHADYLNPELHDELGIPNLVTRSLATTRRFDALKLWVSSQSLGRKRLGEMIDATLDLAAHAAEIMRKDSRLELIHQPTIGCVVFRYQPASPEVGANALNARLRQSLFEKGIAVIGHTVVRGQQCLKFTFMNPMVTKQQVEELVHAVTDCGERLEQSITT
ncbi:MAG TPA: aspartate aminotransferase family protein [Terriglobales bacterium]